MAHSKHEFDKLWLILKGIYKGIDIILFSAYKLGFEWYNEYAQCNCDGFAKIILVSLDYFHNHLLSCISSKLI